jgi:hypothetical protein
MKVLNEATHSLSVPLPAKIKMAEGSTQELPKVSILGYGGNAVDLTDYGVDAPVVYLINGITPAKDKIPYLLDHYKPLGHVTNIKMNKDSVTAEAVHSYPSQESRDVAGGIENGVPYEASMGLQIDVESVVYHAEGMVEANGKVFNAPLYTVGKAKMFELSATLFGRDGETSITKLSKDTLMKIKNAAPVTTPVTPPVVENSNTPAPTPAPAPVVPPVVENKEPAPAPVVPVVHNGGIPDLVANAMDWMIAYPDHKELVRNAVKQGWDEDRLKREIEIENKLNGLPSLPGAFRADTKVENSFLARMALSCGIKPEFIERKVGKQAADHALSQSPMGLKESLMLCANANGGTFTGHSDVHNLSKFVKKMVLNSSFSTIDFPNLMHQVSKWKMEEAWLMDAPFAPEICKAESNNSFRPTGHIKPKGGQMWNGLNQEGKIDHASFGKEDKYETRLSTVAQIVTFKREDIINDDIGWISELLDLMIEGALMVPDYQLVNLMYNALDAGVVTNGVSQHTLAFSAANLETVYDAIKRREIVKGDKAVKARNNTQYMLIHSANLEKAVWEVINQERFVQGPAGDFVGERNYWKDKFTPKMFDQLDNVTYHPQAKDGAWALVPMNTKYAPFAITYLNGMSRPTTETVDLPADELGFGVRGYWDVNLDYRPVENDKLQATAFSFPANT